MAMGADMSKQEKALVIGLAWLEGEKDGRSDWKDQAPPFFGIKRNNYNSMAGEAYSSGYVYGYSKASAKDSVQ
jgi:hypothetical protein